MELNKKKIVGINTFIVKLYYNLRYNKNHFISINKSKLKVWLEEKKEYCEEFKFDCKEVMGNDEKKDFTGCNII